MVVFSIAVCLKFFYFDLEFFKSLMFYAAYSKVHKHDIFFLTFFAETETLWSQGPVRPRYSTFKHFRACSACDEIGSQYAQHAMKLVPRILSLR
jgi:hypothetical protein